MGILSNRFKNRTPPKEAPPKVEITPKKHFLQSDFDPVEELDINLDNLDEENRLQPKLLGMFSRIFGQKYKLYKELDIRLSIRKDEISKMIAQDPEKYGAKSTNITDALVTRVCFGDPKFILISKQFAEAKAERKEWEWLLEACKQRSASIGRALKERELEYSND